MRDQHDANMAPGAGTNGYAIVYNHGTGKFELGTFEAAGSAAAAVAAHVAAGDPHTQYALESALGTMATATETAYLLADGSRTGATSSRQVFTSGITAPSWRPASDSTTALQLQNAAGAAVATVDTANGYLYAPTPSASARSWMRPSGFYVTTNSGTSVNSFTMNGLDTYIDSRGNAHFRNNGTTWLSGGSTAIAFTAGSITFNDVSGSLIMAGASLRGSNNLGLYANDNRFTVTLKQLSAAGGTADVLRVQTQAGGAALYVDVNGHIAVGQISPTALLDLAASTTARASLRVRAGTAPTTPNAGDIWFDGTHFYGYNGSAAVQLDN